MILDENSQRRFRERMVTAALGKLTRATLYAAKSDAHGQPTAVPLSAEK